MKSTTGAAAGEAETMEASASSTPEQRRARDGWTACALPALTDAASREVSDLVERRLREKIDAEADDLEIPREIAPPPPAWFVHLEELDDLGGEG
jgi:hypothetical protein